MPEALAIVVAIAAIAWLFADVIHDHRQTCRRRRRPLLAAAIAAVHRHNLEEGWKAIGGSGGRR